MKIKHIHYGNGMDAGLVELCDVLNSVPGITTTESCEGHGKEYTMIIFSCANMQALTRIQRAIDRRYCGFPNAWEIDLHITDTPVNNSALMFTLRSGRIYAKAHKKRFLQYGKLQDVYEKEFYRDINLIIANVKLMCTTWGDKYVETGDAGEIPTPIFNKHIKEYKNIMSV